MKINLEAERKKALDFIAGKPGVKLEIVRPTVRNGLERTEGEEIRPKEKEEKKEITPRMRTEQYLQSIGQL